MSNVDLEFSYHETKRSVVLIRRSGRVVTTLRGKTALAFLSKVTDLPPAEQQLAMARATGNYRRGNERLSRGHPSNRDGESGSHSGRRDP